MVALRDYSDLYQYNAYLLDGHTVRWSSTTMPAYGVTGVGWQKAIKRWPIVNFQFVATKPAWGIHILGYDDLVKICGLASFTYDSAGALEWCTVKVNIYHDHMNCSRVTNTITHKIGPSEVTSSVAAMLGLLYNLVPGTGIRDQFLVRRPDRIGTMSRYQADGSQQYSRSWR